MPTMNLSDCLTTQNCSVTKKANYEHEDYEATPFFRAQTDTFPIIAAVLIISLNSWVIALVVKKRHLRTVTNIILVSLALSDLCTGALSIPLYLSCNITRITGICTADLIVIIFVSVSTVLHILVMTIDRYICIIHALRYQIWVTHRRGRAVIALIWSISVFTALIQLAWVDLNQDAHDDYGTEIGMKFVVFDIFYLVAFIGLPATFMAFTYARIFYEVRRQTRNIHKNNTPGWQETQRSTKREWKIAVIYLLMLVVFLICWVPFSLLRVEQILQAEFLELHLSDVAMVLLYWMRFCSSFINPCLYILGKPDFRNATCLRRQKERQIYSDYTRASLMKSSPV